MQINKFIIPKEFLNSMSEDEKVFAILLGYLVNEINMLYKCIRIKADWCFTFMFIRLLLGKLYEARKMVNEAYSSPALGLRLKKILSDETNAIRKEINKFFEKNPYIMNIRRHLVFHYDQAIIKRALPEIEKQTLTYFTSDEYDENNFYAFSELAIYEALKKEICPEKNCQEVCQETSPGLCPKGRPPFLKDFLHKTGKPCDLFSKFAIKCLDDIAKANNIDLLEPEKIDIKSFSPKEIILPFCIQRDEDD
jgi:hypothetical protein